MNKALFLFLSATSTTTALSQPVFAEPEMPGLGYTSELVVGAYFAPTVGSEAPQSWDFSGIPGSAVGLMEVEPASTSPYADAFDGAEWIMTNGDQLSFLSVIGGELTVLGNVNGSNGVTLPFSDPLVQWAYPLTFGTQVSDVFGTEQTLFGQPYSLSGQASFEVDAWGSLVMPDGAEFPEVLRGVYGQVYTEAYDGDTVIWDLSQVTYFTPDSVLPIFYHEMLEATDLQGNVLLEATDVAWYANGVLSVPPSDQAAWGLPFPNPVQAGDEVTWPMSSGLRWRAMSMEGKVLDEGLSIDEGRVRISTSGWESGLVLLMALGDDGSPCISCPVHRVVIRR
ncbi:hypothetical protein N9I92_00110 [bacterium]|jgi:hypothetical protein|nr:hypothetical protein [bacterium]